MHDEPIDERTAAFLHEMRGAFLVTEAPSPGPALASLFAVGLANDKGDLPVTVGSNANGSVQQTAGLPNWTRRRMQMLKDLLSQVGSKVVAGAMGATLALGGLGAAGALEAPIRMISEVGSSSEECLPEDDLTTPDVDESCDATDDESAGNDDEGTDDGGSVDDGESTDDDGTDDDGTDDDGTDDDGTDDDGEESDEYPPVPTRVSEAAKIHAFDEACGNHGKYVSHFARTGEEPDCAKDARAAAEDDDGTDDDATDDDGTDDDGTDDDGTDDDGTDDEGSEDVVSDEETVEDDAAKAEAKAERKEAKAEAKAERKEAKDERKAAKANGKGKGKGKGKGGR